MSSNDVVPVVELMKLRFANILKNELTKALVDNIGTLCISFNVNIKDFVLDKIVPDLMNIGYRAETNDDNVLIIHVLTDGFETGRSEFGFESPIAIRDRNGEDIKEQFKLYREQFNIVAKDELIQNGIAYITLYNEKEVSPIKAEAARRLVSDLRRAGYNVCMDYNYGMMTVRFPS
jgi:hypothetical protein